MIKSQHRPCTTSIAFGRDPMHVLRRDLRYQPRAGLEKSLPLPPPSALRTSWWGCMYVLKCFHLLSAGGTTRVHSQTSVHYQHLHGKSLCFSASPARSCNEKGCSRPSNILTPDWESRPRPVKSVHSQRCRRDGACSDWAIPG